MIDDCSCTVWSNTNLLSAYCRSRQQRFIFSQFNSLVVILIEQIRNECSHLVNYWKKLIRDPSVMIHHANHIRQICNCRAQLRLEGWSKDFRCNNFLTQKIGTRHIGRKYYSPKTTFDKCVFQWYTLAERHSLKLLVENIS